MIPVDLTWTLDKEPGSFRITGTVRTMKMETRQMMGELTRIMGITVGVETLGEILKIPGRDLQMKVTGRIGQKITITGRIVRSGGMCRQRQEIIMKLITEGIQVLEIADQITVQDQVKYRLQEYRAVIWEMQQHNFQMISYQS